MKHIKVTLLLLCIIIISGCDVKYNLEINDMIFEENINIYVDPSNPGENGNFKIAVKESYFPMKEDFVNKYILTNISDDKITGMKLTYKYSLGNFKKAKIMNACFRNVVVRDDDKFVYINISDFICGVYDYVEVDSLQLQISTNHRVHETNGERNKDRYTWDLNTLDEIEFSFYKDEFNKKEIDFGTIILIGLFLCLIVIFIYLKKIKKI